jgi:putative transposase
MQKMFEWRTGRSCYYKLLYHLVFVTKYRKGVLGEKMLQRLEEVYKETCEQMGGELLAFGGEEDHVHLMVSVPPKTAVSNLIGKWKGKSSYVLRKEYAKELNGKLWGKHLWSPSYCVVSSGGAALEVVKDYIEQQRTPPSPKAIQRSAQAQQQHRTKKVRGALTRPTPERDCAPYESVQKSSSEERAA